MVSPFAAASLVSLPSGPSWQAVAKVHRHAYGVSGTLVAVALFLSGESGSLDQVSRCLSHFITYNRPRCKISVKIGFSQHANACVCSTYARDKSLASIEPSRAVIQAVFTLDLVAMMAGGEFQDVANTLVEAMEADALDKTDPKPPCAVGTTSSAHTTSVPVCPIGPDLKKAKHDQSMPTDQLRKSGGIRRIQMPPLDVFQREFMETETPVILSGVSECENY